MKYFLASIILIGLPSFVFADEVGNFDEATAKTKICDELHNNIARTLDTQSCLAGTFVISHQADDGFLFTYENKTLSCIGHIYASGSEIEGIAIDICAAR